MEYTVGKELDFEVYGTKIKGTFVSKTDDLIKIKVISDSLSVTLAGETTEISESFLIAYETGTEISAEEKAGLDQKLELLVKHPFTPEEKEIADLIVQAHNKFVDLQRPHPSEMPEWVSGIHMLQSIMTMRAMRRLYPTEFNKI